MAPSYRVTVHTEYRLEGGSMNSNGFQRKIGILFCPNLYAERPVPPEFSVFSHQSQLKSTRKLSTTRVTARSHGEPSASFRATTSNIKRMHRVSSTASRQRRPQAKFAYVTCKRHSRTHIRCSSLSLAAPQHHHTARSESFNGILR